MVGRCLTQSIMFPVAASQRHKVEADLSRAVHTVTRYRPDGSSAMHAPSYPCPTCNAIHSVTPPYQCSATICGAPYSLTSARAFPPTTTHHRKRGRTGRASPCSVSTPPFPVACACSLSEGSVCACADACRCVHVQMHVCVYLSHAYLSSCACVVVGVCCLGVWCLGVCVYAASTQETEGMSEQCR